MQNTDDIVMSKDDAGVTEGGWGGNRSEKISTKLNGEGESDGDRNTYQTLRSWNLNWS